MSHCENDEFLEEDADFVDELYRAANLSLTNSVLTECKKETFFKNFFGADLIYIHYYDKRHVDQFVYEHFWLKNQFAYLMIRFGTLRLEHNACHDENDILEKFPRSKRKSIKDKFFNKCRFYFEY